ncbi:unnamed protein product [Triticum turgidum subsp. durum]|uniref:Uncharacterized protein n=1 Tax=Triticum turgidum subsp. durum TaxID=4567 RepID=A0A9R0Z6Y5_TRITD|nr:unnamed protein product [Triticum turgidum subsp. durum]
MAATMVNLSQRQNSPQDYLSSHKRRPRRRRGGRGELEHEAAGVRPELRQPEDQRLQAPALGRAVRGEHLLGVGRRGLKGGGCGERVGGREEGLRLPLQHLRRGEGVRALHHGLRSRRLQQQPWRLHHLQLRARREYRWTKTILAMISSQ